MTAVVLFRSAAAVVDRRYSYQLSPSVNICTWLPPSAGLTKIVSFAPPRLRFRIEDCGWIMSGPSFVQPCALRFADNSAQTPFTSDLLLKRTCSTTCLYS